MQRARAQTCCLLLAACCLLLSAYCLLPAAGVAAPPAPSAGLRALTWQIESVDQSRRFSSFGNRSVQFDGYLRPHVAYGGNHLFYATWASEGNWQAETADAAVDVGTHSSLAVTASGQPHISYYDARHHTLKHAFKDGTTWVIETVDSAADVGQYTAIALDPTGNPHISYYDATNGDLKYASWTGYAWVIETVDSTGDVGQWTSLAFDGNGAPHISFYDVTNAALKYTRRTGSAWDIEVIDYAGDAGKYSSLAVDQTGAAHIAYYKATGDKILYAQRPATGWTIQEIASGSQPSWTHQDVSLALDSSGNPHVSYCEGPYLSYARWTGSEWQKTALNNEVNVDGKRSLALALNGFNQPLIVHFSSVLYYSNPPRTYLQSEHWNGLRWLTSYRDGETEVQGNTALAVAGDGTPQIAYAGMGEFYSYRKPAVMYARWTGSGWYVKAIAEMGSPSSLAMDLDGAQRPVISRRQASSGGTVTVSYLWWTGNDWYGGAVEQAYTGEHDLRQAIAMVVDPDGAPHIAYQMLDRLHYASRAGESWDIQTVPTGAVAGVGLWPSLAIDSLARPHISYYDEPNGALRYSYWTGSAWQVQVIDDTGDVGRYDSLALDGNGNPRISYYDRTNGDLKLAQWTGSSWAIGVIDTAGDVGLYSSLALDGNGFPHIAYYDQINRDLKYAHWNGSTWDIQVVDAEGDVGDELSLALGPDGNPWISYLDRSGGDIKLAHLIVAPAPTPTPTALPTATATPPPTATRYPTPVGGWAVSLNLPVVLLDMAEPPTPTPTPAPHWVTETVDHFGDAGAENDLALDADGHPHIMYMVQDVVRPTMRYAYWTGQTWITETTPMTPLYHSLSLALDPSGAPHVAYEYQSLGYHVQRTAAGWISETVPGYFTGRPSLALDSAGNPHLAHDDYGRLQYTSWNGSAWVTTTVTRLDTTSVSLVLDAQDNPHLAYGGGSSIYVGAQLLYTSWTGSTWVTQTVDSQFGSGWRTSVALDPSGAPHIIYQHRYNFEIGPARIRYARWTGAAWVTQTLGLTELGSGLAVAADAAGHAHLAYYQNRWLKYAHWTGAAWDIQTIDMTGDEPWFGADVTIKLDAGGRPHIVYYSALNGDLKHAYLED